MSTIYVIEFSDGTVKVGRATDYVARRAQHVYDSKKYGKGITRDFTLDVSWSDVEKYEQAVIDYCLVLGGYRHGREYFRGVEFDDVVSFLMSADFDAESARLAAIIKAQGMEVPTKGGTPHPLHAFERSHWKPGRLRRRGYNKWGESIVERINKRSIPHPDASFTKDNLTYISALGSGLKFSEANGVLSETYGATDAKGRWPGRLMHETLQDTRRAVEYYGDDVTVAQLRTWQRGTQDETWLAALEYLRGHGFPDRDTLNNLLAKNTGLELAV